MEAESFRILVIDDEINICELLVRLLKREGFETFFATSGESGLDMLRSHQPDVVFLDYKMPGITGMDVLRDIKELDRDIPVIMITAYAEVAGAVDAMKAGAHDYLAKPFENENVIRIAHRAASERQLRRRINNLSMCLEGKTSLFRYMGPSKAIGNLISRVNRVAESDFSVVIQGETGSGKELVARAIHNSSPRSEGPFVAVDCGSIQETLLESELFGHEKGSFTGAMSLKPGKFELAGGGTLFLDEVSNMPLGSQAKLLRALQERTVYRVGGQVPVEVNARIISASNRDLSEAVESGDFRDDLFYRINEFSIFVPPLRERRTDISYLARRFLDATNLELDKWVKDFSREAMEALLAYDWPGNVRELRSTVRRAVLMTDDLITAEELDITRSSGKNPKSGEDPDEQSWDGLSLKEIVKEKTRVLEKEVLTRVLRETGGNKARAARILKIDYKTIHTKVKQLGVYY